MESTKSLPPPPQSIVKATQVIRRSTSSAEATAEPVKSNDGHADKMADRVNVSLFGLGGRVRAVARQRRVTVTALIKSALLPMLGDVSGGNAAPVPTGVDDFSVARVGMRMLRKHAHTLARRARACGMSQGQYIGALLEGGPPPEPAKDHTALITALMLSTDRLAAMSVDLNAFMRLVGREPAAQLESHRAGLQSLGKDVRAHLELAAMGLAELRRFRRPQ